MNVDVIKAIYLSNSGRLGRMAYFGYGIALAIAFAVVAGILVTLLGMIGVYLGLVLYLGVLYCQYNVAAKRFQDLNQPGQYALYTMGVAFLAGVLSKISGLYMISLLFDLALLAVALYLLFKPGTPGANDYGPAPTALPGVQ